MGCYHDYENPFIKRECKHQKFQLAPKLKMADRGETVAVLHQLKIGAINEGANKYNMCEVCSTFTCSMSLYFTSVVFIPN